MFRHFRFIIKEVTIFALLRYTRSSNCSCSKHSTPEAHISSQIVAVEITIFYNIFNTLRTGDADLRFYIATVQDG